MWRPFWAFRRLCTRSGSWAGGQRMLTSALLHSAFVCHLRKTRAGRYNQDASMAGRYGAWVYIRDPSVPSYSLSHNTMRCPHLRQIEKKHSNETRERTDCWEDLQAKIVRRTPFLISIWFIFFVLCSLLLYAQVLIFHVSSTHILFF